MHRIVLYICVIVTVSVPAFANGSDHNVLEWIERQWVHAPSEFDEELIYVSWLDRYYEVPDFETLTKLRRVVKNRPQHPQRVELEQYERRIKYGPDIQEVQYWFGKQGYFRRSATSANDFGDIVVAPRQNWSLTDSHLNVINTKHGQLDGYNYAPWEDSGRRQLSGFLNGAFSIKNPSPSAKLEDFSMKGNVWSCSLVSEDPAISCTAEGTWDPELQTGQAHSIELTRMDMSPGEVGKRWVFEDWVEAEMGKGYMCRRVVE